MQSKEIMEKAEYCLNCKSKPCTKGCPLENNIPDFIQAIIEKDNKKAYQILSETTVLQPICGIICPHSKQCEGKCIRGYVEESTSIGDLESFIGNISLEENYPFTDKKIIYTDKKIAVIGGGPSGLTASAFLARKGYKVTIFEKYNKLRRFDDSWNS